MNESATAATPATVRVIIDGQAIDVRPGTTVLDAAVENSVALRSLCGGHMACLECQVRVDAGAENLSPMQPDEEQKLGNTYHITRIRLSCQTRVLGPCTLYPVKREPRRPSKAPRPGLKPLGKR